MASLSVSLAIPPGHGGPGSIEDYWKYMDLRGTKGFRVIQTRIGLRAESSYSTLWLPYAPREVSYEGYGYEWSEVPRDGTRKPLLYPSKRKLKKMSFTIYLGRESWEDPVTSVLLALQEMSNSTSPIFIYYSEWEAGYWRLSNMSIASQMRSAYNNAITRATVNLEFTQASDVRRKDDWNGGPRPDDPGGGVPNRPKKYKVKAGDTLFKIAKKFYGTTNAWKRIAKHNKMKKPSPRKELRVGRVLKLP